MYAVQFQLVTKIKYVNQEIWKIVQSSTVICKNISKNFLKNMYFCLVYFKPKIRIL